MTIQNTAVANSCHFVINTDFTHQSPLTKSSKLSLASQLALNVDEEPTIVQVNVSLIKVRHKRILITVLK